MALFTTPEENAANAPETWQVRKGGYDRTWYVMTTGSVVLERFTTKRAALEACQSGFLYNLWHREARWYAGETPPGHRSWAECKAERERIAARWPA